MNLAWVWCGLGAVSFGALVPWVTAQAESSPVRFTFRTPRQTSYLVDAPARDATAPGERADWLKARPERGPARPVEFGSRLVLQLTSSADLPRVLYGRSLRLDRTVAPNLFILQAPDAMTALQEAQALAALPNVLASHPVQRRRVGLHGPYAAPPRDPYFPRQWHLENRQADGSSAGPDINVRAAWPFTRGEGVTIAVADDGVEVSHPDLAKRTEGAPHYNFIHNQSEGQPVAPSQSHGTAVAGIVAASANARGVAGVAPRARLASWVIFDVGDNIVSEERLMDMFQFASNVVSVQNHSWGNADSAQLAATLLERTALTNALTLGRDGKGIIMVRSGGNNRADAGDTNDDEYASDPRAIAVAAIRTDGRAASYSNPGACLLVAAPSSDRAEGFAGIVTTDRQGTLGENRVPSLDDSADYAFDASAFTGTSAAAPQIAGLAALLVAVNPALTYRDVQQILIHSARHFDFADPDLRVNGAGYRVSHSAGFGVPDAGVAMRLARPWPNRPPLRNITLTANTRTAIPDDALRLVVTGTDVPARLQSIRTLPSNGPHADTPTPALPLVPLGLVTGRIDEDLHGRGALMQRGQIFFREKIEFAAQAGAAFAVIYNNKDGDELVRMGLTDFVPIAAVFIGQNDGEALRDYLAQDPDARAQIRLDAATYTFEVADSLLCEHVGLTVTTDHPRRGDLRVTLLSPMGTRSVLQHVNLDTSSGPDGWTYYSTHHFYENSAGAWTVAIADEEQNNAGAVTALTLTIYGVPIKDTDRDGLDDDWETAHFGALAQGPKDDPDADGYPNAREQIVGTDPAQPDLQLVANLSRFSETLFRLSWPTPPNAPRYELLTAPEAAGPFSLLTNVPGRFPETELFLPAIGGSRGFFHVKDAKAPVAR
jgi:subtilisin family serine protease/subtilisin-like proprotein convertase family protein